MRVEVRAVGSVWTVHDPSLLGTPSASVPRWSWRVGVASLVVVFGLSACATDEYKATEAEQDLMRAGWSKAQAHCLVSGIQKHFGDQYIRLNNTEKVDRVNPDAVDLYVRNVLASQKPITNDERAMVKQLAAICRS